MTLISLIDLFRSLFIVPEALSYAFLLAILFLIAYAHRYKVRELIFIESPLFILAFVCLYLQNMVYLKYLIGVWLLTKMKTIVNFRVIISPLMFLILCIFASIVLKWGDPLYAGLAATSLFSSGNAFIISLFLLAILVKSKWISQLLSLIIPIILNSKLFILAIFRSYFTLILSSLVALLAYLSAPHVISILIPRVFFFIDNYGVFYFLTSGRLERLMSSEITFSNLMFGMWTPNIPNENFENDLIFPLYNFGFAVSVYLYILIFSSFSGLQNKIPSKDRKFTFMLFLVLLMTGHFIGNTILILLFAQIYRKNV